MAKTYAKPFLKWAGGKSQLLQQFELFIPSNFDKYIEPFVGGGALFFRLFSKNMIKEAILLDYNQELIDCYKAIRSNLKDLTKHLSKHKKKHYKLAEEYYYRVRNRIRNNLELWHRLPIAERASITIYLNKTCYNGLYRVNRNNQFNVPVGRYKKPEIYDLDNLKAVNEALRIAKIIDACDFAKCLPYGEKNDFVYLDPPYNPLSKTSNFTGYTKNGFNENEQMRLAEVYRELDKKKCKVMLSNSDTELVKRLYKGYRIEKVKASRAICCNASARGKISELVILNY